MKIVLLVTFVIICLLLVFLVLIQDEDNSGMGGLLSGGNSAAFGSHSASILTKATVVLAILFFAVTLCLAKVLPSKTNADTQKKELSAAAESAGVAGQNTEVKEETTEGAPAAENNW